MLLDLIELLESENQSVVEQAIEIISSISNTNIEFNNDFSLLVLKLMKHSSKLALDAMINFSSCLEAAAMMPIVPQVHALLIVLGN